MFSTAAMTILKMIESLPKNEQDRIVEVLRSYIQDFHEEEYWDKLYARTQPQLIEVARLAKKKSLKANLKLWMQASYEVSRTAFVLGEIQIPG